jgi:hypothetical protein
LKRKHVRHFIQGTRGFKLPAHFLCINIKILKIKKIFKINLEHNVNMSNSFGISA